MTVGESIRTLRLSKKMTQKQLGELSGIAEPTIRRYEAGKLNPKIETVKKIADALGVHVFDLMGVGEKFDRLHLIPEIPADETPENRQAILEIASTDPRKLYDGLSIEKKREFWKLINESSHEYKEAPSISDAAMKLAKDYDALDIHGRQVLRMIADEELARMANEARLLRETAPDPDPEPKVIPLFWSAPAAGIASPILGEDYDIYELQPDDPQGAMFAVKVSGNSMEPYFPDGSIAFCNKDPMADGDIGVFSIDSGSVIKQYYYDPVLKMTYLFSLNRDRSDADVLITSTSGQTLACLGRVITRRRFPIPGR